MSPEERDAYCAESAWVATALGARPADVPVSWTHASEQLSRMYASGILAVGSQARELSTAVLSPRVSRLVPLLPSWNRLVSVGMLPSSIREHYRLTWNDADEHRFDRLVLRLRGVRRRLPDFVALWPEARS